MFQAENFSFDIWVRSTLITSVYQRLPNFVFLSSNLSLPFLFHDFVCIAFSLLDLLLGVPRLSCTVLQDFYISYISYICIGIIYDIPLGYI